MAFCSKCGAMLAEGANFCSNCGATVQTAPLAAQPVYTQPVTVTQPVYTQPTYTQPVQTAYAISRCDWSSDVCSSDLPTNSVRGFPFLHTLSSIYCL